MKAISVHEFIQEIECNAPATLPALHSTTSAKIFDIVGPMKLQSSPCDKFVGENLLYFFIGRPAYKSRTSEQASYWQCPTVFIIKDLDSESIERIYPFDTGAFVDRRFPSYITVFPLVRFSLGKRIEVINKLIPAFFENAKNYILGLSMSEDKFIDRNNITPKHQEIQALLRLYNDRLPAFDDRGKCIEVQLRGEVELNKENLIGVIMPKPYELEHSLIDRLKLTGCKVEFYEIFPLNVENYYSEIYRISKIIIERSNQ